MRKSLIVAALLVAAPVAQAAPLMVAGAPHVSNGAPSNVVPVACLRYGWRGAGVYPGCYPAPRYAMVAPYYVAPPAYVAPVVVPPPRRCWYGGAWRRC